MRIVSIEKQTRPTLNLPGFAHGLSTAGHQPALEARWRPTVGNPAHCLLDHKTKEDIPFRSPVQQCAGITSVEIERTTYIALKEAGFEDVRNYYGSWNEWSRDPELPIHEGVLAE